MITTGIWMTEICADIDTILLRFFKN
jgi:hypothetical protein